VATGAPLRSPGGDPLLPLRGIPRAWAARIPTPTPRYRKRRFPGVPPRGSKKGLFWPFSGLGRGEPSWGSGEPSGTSRGPLPGTAGPRREGLM